MRGILMDVDHVIAGAHARIAAAGVADRCQTVAGDFFNAVPAGGDAYVMKHIIHDWDDERAVAILRNIHAAMGQTRGKVILLEGVIASANEPSLGKVMDIEMLLLPGGRERTAEEFRTLFDRAGFDLTRIVPTKSPVSVIEARSGDLGFSPSLCLCGRWAPCLAGRVDSQHGLLIECGFHIGPARAGRFNTSLGDQERMR